MGGGFVSAVCVETRRYGFGVEEDAITRSCSEISRRKNVRVVRDSQTRSLLCSSHIPRCERSSRDIFNLLGHRSWS
jgi:hypothetical protein